MLIDGIVLNHNRMTVNTDSEPANVQRLRDAGARSSERDIGIFSFHTRARGHGGEEGGQIMRRTDSRGHLYSSFLDRTVTHMS